MNERILPNLPQCPPANPGLSAEVIEPIDGAAPTLPSLPELTPELNIFLAELSKINKMIRRYTRSGQFFPKNALVEQVTRPTVALLSEWGFIDENANLNSIKGSITRNVAQAGRSTLGRDAVEFHSVYGPTNMRVAHCFSVRRIMENYYEQHVKQPQIEKEAPKISKSQFRLILNRWAVDIVDDEEKAIRKIVNQERVATLDKAGGINILISFLGVLISFQDNDKERRVLENRLESLKKQHALLD